jgi:hypothetical protein
VLFVFDDASYRGSEIEGVSGFQAFVFTIGNVPGISFLVTKVAIPRSTMILCKNDK